ncbi:MAG: carbamate kinase [Fidelibacterota bacterium]
MTREGGQAAVVALGGNALSPRGERDTIANQFDHTRRSLRAVVHLIRQGYELVITHGNGPQVGNALLRTELTAHKAPLLPLEICVADVEGGMGYMIQQVIHNLLKESGIEKDVVTVITQVVVDKEDPELKKPTKFIGQRYDAASAERLAERFGWRIQETAPSEWRRVVPSPNPLSTVEADSIRKLVKAGKIVVASGGGGIPVYLGKNGEIKGLDGVVDKDLASAVLAHEIEATQLIILTDVDGVALNFGKKDESWLKRISPDRAREYLDQGHFPPGSMGPKIGAALNFLDKGGESVLICSVDHVSEALRGEAGTVIARSLQAPRS